MSALRNVALAFLVVASVVAGAVAFSGGAAAANVGSITALDHRTPASVQSGENVTLHLTGLDTNSSNVTITAKNLANSTVTTITSVPPRNDTMNVTFTPSANGLSQGWYLLTATQKSGSGLSTSKSSKSMGLEVDDQPPRTAFTVNNTGSNLSLAVAAWDGVNTTTPGGTYYASENLRNLTVSVAGPVNRTLTLADGNFSANENIHRTRSYYNATLAGVPDGVYDLTVGTATDGARNTNATPGTNTSYVLDTVIPVVDNVTSAGGTDGVVKGGTTVTVSANLTERFPREVAVNASAFGAGLVTLTTNETVNRTHQTATYTGSFTVNASNASADGAYAPTLVVTDAGGHRVTRDLSAYTLDTHAPTFGSHAPNGTYVNDSATPITLGVGDANAVTGRVAVTTGNTTLSNGTFANATGASYAGGMLTVDPTAFAGGGYPEGPVNVTVTARDPVGHTNRTHWSFVVDTLAPTLSNATASDASGPSGDRVVGANSTIHVGVDATDAHLANTTLTADLSAFGAGTVALSPTGNGTYAANASVAGGTDGTYPVSVRAVDPAGNVNETSAGNLTLDTEAPTVNVTSPANGTYTNDTTPTVTAAVNDSTLSTVRVHLEGSRNGSVALLDGTWNASALRSGVSLANGTTLTLANGRLAVRLGNRTVPDGPAFATVSATDAQAHATNDTTSFHVDSVAPTVTDVRAVDVRNGNGIVAPGNEVRVRANVTDASPTTVTADLSAFAGPGNASVTMTPVNGTAGTTTAANGTDATYAATVNVTGGVPDGNASATVHAVDAAGNANDASSSTLVVDSTAPTFGTLEPAGRYLSTDRPTFSLPVDPVDNALDRNATRVVVANATTTYLNATPAANANGVTYANGTLTTNLSAAGVTLPDGNVTVSVAAADVDGNANTTTRTYTVDTVAPTVTNVGVTGPHGNGYVTDGDPVRVSAGVVDANTRAVVADSSTLGIGRVTLTRNATGAYTATVPVNVSARTETPAPVSVVALDEAGHETSVGRTLHLDTVAPPTPTPTAGNVTTGPISAANASAHDVTVRLPAGHEPLRVGVTLTGSGGGTATATSALTNATTVSVPVNATSLADGAVAVNVSTTDRAGNTAGAATYATATKDTAAPTVASATGEPGSDVVYVATSEPVSGVSPATLAVTNHTVANVTARSSRFYVARLDGPVTAGDVGTSSVSLGANVTDGVGNPATGSGATLRAGATGVRRAQATVGSRNVTLYFDGAVTAANGTLTASDVRYRDGNGANASTVTAVRGPGNTTTMTVELDRPVAPGDLGADGVILPAGTLVNARNESIGAVNVSIADTEPPTVSAFTASATNRSVRVRVNASEPLATVRVHVAAIYGNASDTLALHRVASANGTDVYAATYDAPGDDRYTATLVSAVDYGDNSIAGAPTANASVDTEDPHETVARIASMNQNTTAVEVSFNEPVSFANLTPGDVSLNGTNLSVSNVSAPGVGTSFTATVNGQLDTADGPTVSVAPGVVSEASGDGTPLATTPTPVYALVRHLSPGSTFVSVPMETGSVSLRSMNLTGVTAVWTYENGSWQSFDPSAPRNDFHTLVGGRGYVFVTDRPRTFEFAVHNVAPNGSEDARTLTTGWNLVGPWQETPMTANRTLSGLWSNVIDIRRSAGGFDYAGVNDTDTLRPGRGYWVYVSANGTYRPVPVPANGGGASA